MVFAASEIKNTSVPVLWPAPDTRVQPGDQHDPTLGERTDSARRRSARSHRAVR